MILDKHSLNRFLERRFGVRFCRLPAPRGWLRLHDLMRLSKHEPIKRIFDVGANTGQSALEFAEDFPDAVIECFEPVSSTFQKLLGATSRHPNIHAHCFGFSQFARRLPMHVAEESVFSSLSEVPPYGGHQTETADFRTMDDYLAERMEAGVDLLKIDTEGHDLEVLKGARVSLEQRRVRIIQVECGIGQCCPRFQPLEDFVSYLRPFGYSLMGIYDQRDWQGELRLGFANAVFLAEEKTPVR